MKAAAVLARLFLCIAFVAGGSASSFAQYTPYSPELKQKAEQGDVQAQLKLGEAYYFGEGVEENKPEGIKWFRLAAEQGHADAQSLLALAYNTNYADSPKTHFKKDDYKAYIWHALAGHTDEAADLQAKLKPEKIEEELKNFPPALQKKAKQSFVEVEAIIKAKVYQDGEGVEQDYYKAYIWYAVAGETQGAADLQAKLKPEKIEEELKNFPPALQKKAKQSLVGIEARAREMDTKARAKTVEAYYKAGTKFEEGDDVLPNYKLAARFYEYAAERSHASAQYRLGLMYLSGKGVVQDYGKAYIWLALAALNTTDGEIKEDAAKKRQAAEEKLTTEELNQAQAEARKKRLKET